MDVCNYGERITTPGLNLVTGPGNDIVASTVLAAAGCQLLLFTTGRGTPLGSVIPTIKIASNHALAERKNNWIDWDAQAHPDTEEFASYVLAVANGKMLTANEKCRNFEIAIFKDGVTL